MSKIRFPEDMPKAPSVADADKMMLADASTNEAKHITFDQAKQYFTIEGQRIAPITPGALPTGPSGQTRYMEVSVAGSWTSAGNTFTNQEGHISTFWWNGSTWSKVSDVELPIVEGTDVLNPTGEYVPKEKAVADYVFKNSLQGSDFENIVIFPNKVPFTLFLGYYHANGTKVDQSTSLKPSLSTEYISAIEGDIINLSGYMRRDISTASGIKIQFRQADNSIISDTDLKGTDTYRAVAPPLTAKYNVVVAYNYDEMQDLTPYYTSFEIVKGDTSGAKLVIEPRVESLELNTVDKSSLNGKVELGDTKLVTGGEVYNKAMIQSVYTNKDVIIGKNKFDKSKVVLGKVMNSLGEIITSAGSGMTGAIPVKAGQSYIGSGAFSANSSKRMGLFVSEEDTTPVQFVSGSYSITPNQDGFLRVNIITTISDFSNTFQLEEGGSATAYEPYSEVVMEKFKEEFLPQITPVDYNNDPVDSVELISRELYADNINSVGSGVFRKKVRIPNSYGEVLKNVVVPITLINSSNTEPLEYDRFVFLDGNSKDDFSDVRFVNDGKVLPVEVGKSVNVKVQPFNHGLTTKEMQQSPIDGRYYCSHSDSTRYSTDLKTWTTLIANEPFVFVNKQGDIFTSAGSVLKKYKYSENFSTGRVVITLPYENASWNGKRVTYDKFGHIYFGTYQGEFDARIWKSTDEGDSFVVVLGSDINKSQHCHNIVCDTSVEPNILYASFDGTLNGSETDVSQWESYDYGATWVRRDLYYTLGYRVDSGIMYAEGDFLVGSSEGDAKTAPNIYYSKDRGDTWNIVEEGFQTFTAYRLKNFLLTQSIPRYNETLSKMCVMDMDGNVTPLITRNTYFKISTTGAGYRYGSTDIMDYQGKECYSIFVGEGGLIMPSIMVTSEVGDYTAEALVMIDELPIEGLEIDVHTGYELPVYNQNIFIEKDRLKPILERSFKEVFQEPYPRHSSFIKDYTLYNDKKMKSVREINLVSNLPARPEYSVSFWISTKGHQPSMTTPIINVFGNDLIIFNPNSTTLRYAGVAVTGVFYGSGDFKSYMLTLTVSSNEVSVYVNGSFKSSFTISDAQANGISINGANLPNSIFISDLKIYDKALSLNDVRKIHSYNIVI